ncbi:response regulator transcription factor [Chloroflexota bacterium]
MKILIIEDNPDIVDIVTLTLQMRWSQVNLITTLLGLEGINLAKTEEPDIILLDLGLPDTDGFHVLHEIRKFSDVPVVILTVRGDETDKIRGLESGADDYITKPFSTGELLARMQALVRRSQLSQTEDSSGKPSIPSRTGKLRMDFTSGEVSLDGVLLKLGPREYELLHILVLNEGKPLSKQELMKEVFPENESNTWFVDVYIKKLREKLGESLDEPKIIVNEGKEGYKFVN